MQLKPITFPYPTNDTFSPTCISAKMVERFDSFEVTSSERKRKTRRKGAEGQKFQKKETEQL